MLTRLEISEMMSREELDLEPIDFYVAEMAMKWRSIDEPAQSFYALREWKELEDTVFWIDENSGSVTTASNVGIRTFKPTRWIEDAWNVVNRMHEESCELSLNYERGKWEACFFPKDQKNEQSIEYYIVNTSHMDNVCVSICYAAILARIAQWEMEE